MTEKHISTEDKNNIVRKPKTEAHGQEAPPANERAALVSLQAQIGNRAVQRLLAQRSGDGPSEVDDDTAGQINSQRGGGQPLDSAVQTQMGAATGHDFSSVKVHTGPEAHTLNEQLGAKAFTTGQDVFFRSGEYNPGSSGGQELLAHELTHVVQQGTGQVSGAGSKMTVNAPGDQYEQEADAVAKSVTAPGATANVQRQEEEELAQTKLQLQEEEEEVQMQEEEEEMQMKPLQTKLQLQEEEEEVQMQEEEEEVQMEEMPEEEEMAA